MGEAGGGGGAKLDSGGRYGIARLDAVAADDRVGSGIRGRKGVGMTSI